MCRRGVVRAEIGVSFSFQMKIELVDRVSETVKRKMKRQEDEFLGMLLGTLGASMLEYMLIENRVINAENRVVRAGTGFNTLNCVHKSFSSHSIPQEI